MTSKQRKQPKRNPPAGFGSIRAYAKHRAALKLIGGSHRGVIKAIEDSRISAPDPATLWLDFAKADREWANNTVGQSVPQAQLNDYREIPIDPKTGEPDWLQYPVGRRGTERLIWLKQRDYEQRLEERAGILIQRSKARRALHDHGRQRLADEINGIPRTSQQVLRAIRAICPQIKPSDDAKILHAIEVVLNGETVARYSEPILDLEIESAAA